MIELLALTPPAEVMNPIRVLLSWAAWIVFAIFVVVVVVIGGSMGFEKHQGNGELPRSGVWLIATLFGATISASAASWVTWAM